MVNAAIAQGIQQRLLAETKKKETETPDVNKT
jgi:hypothetical protein